MHFSTLAKINLPETENDYETDIEIGTQLLKLKAYIQEHPDDIVAKVNFQNLWGMRTAFSRNVASCIDELLEPYCESTDDPEYLEFEDHTEELKKEYDGAVDCIKLPEGRIVTVYNRCVWDKFVIHDDGKVYQKYFGQLKHDKRSKRAKKMTALREFPYKKLYKTFEDFAEQERCFDYNEEHGGYGYEYNPNAFYDWYQIGGRWPKHFLVKSTCEEYSVGERSWSNEDTVFEAPEGYIWVCAARKKDIEWQSMYEWSKEKAIELFAELEQHFADGNCPKEWYAHITEEGIFTFGDALYIKGETLDEYLSRRGISEQNKYQYSSYGYVDEDGYFDRDSTPLPESDEKTDVKDEWRKQLYQYIDDADDNDVFVGIDYHI